MNPSNRRSTCLLAVTIGLLLGACASRVALVPQPTVAEAPVASAPDLPVAPEVVVKVREMLRAASPLPAPQRLGGTRYLDIWLVDKSGRGQLDTLTEGQL